MKRKKALTYKDIKSIHNAGVRSIPKVQGSNFLDLYMLNRERERLDKELTIVEERKTVLTKEVNGILSRIKDLQKDTHKELLEKNGTNIPNKALKTMQIHY